MRVSSFARCAMAFASLAFVQATPSKPLSVRLSSVGSPFAIQSQFQAQCRLDPNGLTVEVKQGAVLLRPGMVPRRLVSLKVGLARPKGDAWESALWSEPLAVGRDMKPGERVNIAPHTFSIRLDPSVDLTTHWLIVEHQEAFGDGRAGSSYVHSARNVFARWK